MNLVAHKYLSLTGFYEAIVIASQVYPHLILLGGLLTVR